MFEDEELEGTPVYSVETFIKWLKFYDLQGLSLKDCIELLEYDGTLFDKSKSVRGA